MNRLLWSVTAAIALALIASSENARAQAVPRRGPAGTPSARPAVSPYLDLTRRGDPAFNYYRRIRPEQELRAAVNQQSGAIQDLQRKGETGQEGAGSGLSSTGHPVQFMNYSHYYGAGPRKGR